MIEGNSHKERDSQSNRKHIPEPMKPVADGKIEKRGGLLMEFLKKNNDNIKEYVIETIIIPGIIDTIGGIGEMFLDSLTETIGMLFEKKGFSSEKRHGKSTNYNSISSKKNKGRRFYKDDDDIDEEDDDERSYDNVRVRTEREAANVVKKLRERIDDVGYATVANLYELTENIVTWADHQHGWTSLKSADWVRVKDRKKPWLLVFPKPKNLNDLK